MKGLINFLWDLLPPFIQVSCSRALLGIVPESVRPAILLMAGSPVLLGCDAADDCIVYFFVSFFVCFPWLKIKVSWVLSSLPSLIRGNKTGTLSSGREKRTMQAWLIVLFQLLGYVFLFWTDIFLLFLAFLLIPWDQCLSSALKQWLVFLLLLVRVK